MTYAHSSPFQIEERRRKVASYLARAMTETAIAAELGVDQTTISRDVNAIKENSNKFIYELARSDICFYYKQKLDSLDEAKRAAWDICKNTNDQSLNTDKVKLLALKLIIMADEAAIKLLDGGPSVLAMQTMEHRLSQVESDQNDVE